ncbi:hypothetical protein MTR_2g064080 [Medicago truncatula]|uniref:Uncharacterized protein n=1 Tax=Medicago truncatula TaxID=3880 RepID=G7IGW2_MEDTR|nr:hypothetical protein MTR_2g064080 [Medicago truncatula]
MLKVCQKSWYDRRSSLMFSPDFGSSLVLYYVRAPNLGTIQVNRVPMFSVSETSRSPSSTDKC